MSKIKRMVPVLVFASTLAVFGCASQQAAHTTGEVTSDTGSAVGSVLNAVGAVVMWPFHVIGDMFS